VLKLSSSRNRIGRNTILSIRKSPFKKNLELWLASPAYELKETAEYEVLERVGNVNYRDFVTVDKDWTI
jgi:hypothetical protein